MEVDFCYIECFMIASSYSPGNCDGVLCCNCVNKKGAGTGHFYCFDGIVGFMSRVNGQKVGQDACWF